MSEDVVQKAGRHVVCVLWSICRSLPVQCRPVHSTPRWLPCRWAAPARRYTPPPLHLPWRSVWPNWQPRHLNTKQFRHCDWRAWLNSARIWPNNPTNLWTGQTLTWPANFMHCWIVNFYYESQQSIRKQVYPTKMYGFVTQKNLIYPPLDCFHTTNCA